MHDCVDSVDDKGVTMRGRVHEYEHTKEDDCEDEEYYEYTYDDGDNVYGDDEDDEEEYEDEDGGEYDNEHEDEHEDAHEE